MANKDFKVKNGLDIQTPLPVSMGGTGQTSTTNTLNSLLPAQSGNSTKFLQTDGTNVTWTTPVKGLNSGTAAQRPGSPSNGDLYFNTDDMQIEVYQNGNWLIANITPGIPTGVTATNQGSGRAFNNGQASIAFTAATSGGPVKTFTVTPSPSTSPSTFTGTSSPISVTGLASSTQYTYTVTASSNIGTSSASSASSGVTATTVPQAPTIGTATGGNAQADVTFTAGATGGSSITSYTVTSNPGSITASGASSPITVTGLTNGTAYTFTVTATNANGTSSASSASNSVTPVAYLLPTSYEPIAVMTVPVSGQITSLTFGNIPQTYTHLQIRGVARITTAGKSSGRQAIRFNGDSGGNYSFHGLSGEGGSVYAENSSGNTFMQINGAVLDGNTANVYSPTIIDILDYTNTNKYKTIKSIHGADYNDATQSGYMNFYSGLWSSTAAVNSITIGARSNFNDLFKQYSSFALYGIMGS